MPNKTIYVSEKDESLFEEAKAIAGEALSSVIVRALSEYVTRNSELAKGYKEVTIKVGPQNAEREQRFIGLKLGEWKGFSDDMQWWMNASIYKTQKGNFAINLITVTKASLLTNKKEWKEKGEYLINVHTSKLIVGEKINEFENAVPSELFKTLQELTKRHDIPIEYLDI